MRSALTLVPVLLAVVACQSSDPDPKDTGPEIYDPAGWPIGDVVQVEGRGILASLPTPMGDLQIMRLKGDHYEMGRQMGVLVGPQVKPLWDTFLASFAEDLDMDPKAIESTFGYLVDGAWNNMIPYVPPAQMSLIAGMNDAMGVSGDDPCYPCRIVAISNISDINAEEIMDAVPTVTTGMSDALDTYYAEGPDAVVPSPRPPSVVRLPFATCSFFAAWGSRTEAGHLIAHRNLDWNADTGIADSKMVTIYQPEDGGHAYATIGYVGMVGALAGLSSTGVAVSEVGSTGVLERLMGQPWVLRNSEILENADDLDQALSYHANTVSDGFSRPPTIGYNLLVAWGDPVGAGGAADASVVESNGAMVSFFRGGADGTAEVHTFDREGLPAEDLFLGTDPVNAEADAVEIDASGNARTFAWDGVAFVTDEKGNYIEDPKGQVMGTGLPLTEALFRGDEAMSHMNRRFQMAANGPQNGDGGMMVRSGSYGGRYLPMRGMLEAYASGDAYQEDGVDVVPAGQATPIALAQGEAIARHAAMGGNILSVIYDATALQVRVAYETGTGDTWVPASEQPAYQALDLQPAFDFE